MITSLIKPYKSPKTLKRRKRTWKLFSVFAKAYQTSLHVTVKNLGSHYMTFKKF
jgi:hypothetical protein